MCGVASKPHDELGALSWSKRLAPTGDHGIVFWEYLGTCTEVFYFNLRICSVQDGAAFGLKPKSIFTCSRATRVTVNTSYPQRVFGDRSSRACRATLRDKLATHADPDRRQKTASNGTILNDSKRPGVPQLNRPGAGK